MSMMISIVRNCSTYNPCGSNGYCRDNSKGEITCICRFWWKGTLCDELSSSGKQVIALGVITGFLVVLYYGSELFRCVYKKRRQTIHEKKTMSIPTVQRNSSVTTVATPDHLERWLSLLVVSGTIVLGGLAILIKSIILKNIHKEIVYKFMHNQSLFYSPPSICYIVYMRSEFNMFTFPVACLIILIFFIVTKRESLQQQQCCKGHFGLPIPLDFFSCVRRTFAAITFAIFADELSNIANQFINENGSSINEGVIVTYIVQIVKVLVIGFRCYPILAAVYMNTTFALAVATLYAWFDFSITVAFNGVCRNDFYSTVDNFNKSSAEGTIIYLNYYGTGSKLIFFQLLSDTPRYLFLAYISVSLPILLLKRVRYAKFNIEPLSREQENLLFSSLTRSAESQYVKRLFGFTKTNISVTNPVVRCFQSIYQWRDDFRFSSRVLCVYASIFFLLFFLTLQACVQIPPFLGGLQNILQALIDLIIKISIGDNLNLERIKDSTYEFPIPDLVRPYFFAIFTALVVTLVQLLVLLSSIRRNLLQAFRGDDSEIPRCTPSQNVEYACDNIHFAGYLIGYVLWGYILIALLVLVIGVIIDVLVTYGLVRILESILKVIIPPLLFAIFQIYMNRILAQYVFLQQQGRVLSIHHRRFLMIFLYFNFFLDAFLGFISSIIRVLKGTIGGILYMCRLDCSSMGRKLESLEAGFSAYYGFIHMECAHRHPVLLYFTSLLLREHVYGTPRTRCSKARRKWYLAVFLLNNPTLIYRRKQCLSGLSVDLRLVALIERKNSKTLSTEQSINHADSSMTLSIEIGNDQRDKAESHEYYLSNKV